MAQNLQDTVVEAVHGGAIHAAVQASRQRWLDRDEVMSLYNRHAINPFVESDNHLVKLGPEPEEGLFMFGNATRYTDAFAWIDVGQPGRRNCVSDKLDGGVEIGFTEASLNLANGGIFYRRTHHWAAIDPTLALVHYLAVMPAHHLQQGEENLVVEDGAIEEEPLADEEGQGFESEEEETEDESEDSIRKDPDYIYGHVIKSDLGYVESACAFDAASLKQVSATEEEAPNEAIKKKIMALAYGISNAEIATVDTQESYGGYIDEAAILHAALIPVNNIQAPVNTYQSHVINDLPYVESACALDGAALKQVSATEEAPAPEIVHEASNEVQEGGESDPRTGEVPKRSYASIVKVMKENSAPMSAWRTLTKVAPKKQEDQAIHIPLPMPLSEKSDSGANLPVNDNDQDNERALGPSIYLKGLPLDATPALLENEFQKFGLIRTNGIQVKSQKGFCFGFVEFESASSMQSAIEASPVMLNGHTVVVEEKRSTARGNYRGRSSFGVNTGYRNEGERGRGSFGG